jgi:hypothetical protein
MEKKMKIDINIPDGKVGDWEVKTFTITEEEAKFANLRAMLHSGRGYISPGIYKKLTRNGEIIMSNSPDEKLIFCTLQKEIFWLMVWVLVLHCKVC